MANKIEIEHEGDAYTYLSSIQGLADSLTNIYAAYEIPSYIETQIHGHSVSIITLAKMAERQMMEFGVDFEKDIDVKSAIIADMPEQPKPDTMSDLPDPRIADDIDRVDLSKLSVTELYGILNTLNDTLNDNDTSQTFCDFLMPFFDDAQQAFYKTAATSPAESLMKVTVLAEDELRDGSSYGPGTLKEAQKFTEVTA